MTRPRTRAGRPPGQAERAQATVETALVLPVVVLLLLVVVQAGLVVRDRVVVVHAARVAAREVAVDPSGASARRALGEIGDRFELEVSGGGTPGAMARVSVARRVTRVPLVGLVLGGLEVSETLAVRVEG